MPFNPITLPFSKGLRIKVIMPQGWRFFTRDPRESRTLAFAKQRDGGWRSVSFGPNASPRNLFGIKRNSRAQDIEIGLITAHLRANQWTELRNLSNSSIDVLAVAGSVDNTSPEPTLCGTIVVAKQPPVPWAWSQMKTKPQMPSRCVKIDLSCPRSL
jgi:antimicrobial peptide system SdpA family protein